MKLLYFLYRSIISPAIHLITGTVDRGCRYTPTCSQYAYLAVKKYGIIRGAYKAIKRFLSCGPWSPGGHDHV